ncbi:MAG: hypothetical protein K2Z81_26625 [Cyanobacteria bacterium]|nr:hypothetical protein [Cyanobacteriota bacterium]
MMMKANCSAMIALSVISLLGESMLTPQACYANNMGPTNTGSSTNPSSSQDGDTMTITTPAEAGNPGVFGVTVGVSSTAAGAPLGAAPCPPKKPSNSLDPNNPDDRAAKLANDLAIIMALQEPTSPTDPTTKVSKQDAEMEQMAAFLILMLQKQKEREAAAAAAAAAGSTPPPASRKAPPNLFQNLQNGLNNALHNAKGFEEAAKNAKTAQEQLDAQQKADEAKKKANDIQKQIDDANKMYDE